MTVDEAAAFREKLITVVYPELNSQDGYMADTSMAALAKNLGVTESEVWEIFDRNGQRNSIAAKGVAKVIRGESTASLHYQQSVWQGLRQLAGKTAIVADEVGEAIDNETGSFWLRDKLLNENVATLTGRIRAGVGYTESKNTPFQSLASDGAKLALWNLLFAGFDLYGFVHDEVLVNVPAESATGDAKRIVEIMERSMEEVLGGIPAVCEWAVSDRWAKPG